MYVCNHAQSLGAVAAAPAARTCGGGGALLGVSANPVRDDRFVDAASLGELGFRFPSGFFLWLASWTGCGVNREANDSEGLASFAPLGHSLLE